MDIYDLSLETIKTERKTRQIMGCNYINTDGFFSCPGHPQHFLLVKPSAKPFNYVDRFLVCKNVIEVCFLNSHFISLISFACILFLHHNACT